MRSSARSVISGGLGDKELPQVRDAELRVRAGASRAGEVCRVRRDQRADRGGQREDL